MNGGGKGSLEKPLQQYLFNKTDSCGIIIFMFELVMRKLAQFMSLFLLDLYILLNKYIEPLHLAKNRFKCFTNINSFNPNKEPMW